MTDELSKSPQPSSDLSSASESSSRDALDSASVKHLASALHGLTQRHDDARVAVEAEKRKAAFREQVALNAIAGNASELKALRLSIERLIKLFREVIGGERDVLNQAVKRLDESAKFMVHKPEADEEITASHLKVKWSTLVKYLPIAAKGAGIVAVAATAVWALLRTYWPFHH